MIREGFTGITNLFIDTVRRVDDTQWQQPGLGEWTVRELVGHVCMGTFLNVERSLDKPPTRVDLQRPVEFWVRGRPADHDATVAQSGRDMGVALGDDPVGAVCRIVNRVRARIDASPDDAILTTRAGGMRLVDFLATRVFECTVHTLDLAMAIRVDIVLPEPVATITLQLLGERVIVTGQTVPLILAATGRGPLAMGFSVL